MSGSNSKGRQGGGKRPNSPRYSDRYGAGHVNPYLGGQPGQSKFIRDMEERQQAARRQSEQEAARRAAEAAENARLEEERRRAEEAARAAERQRTHVTAEAVRGQERDHGREDSQPRAMRDPKMKERLRQIQERAVREAKSLARGDEVDFGDIDFVEQPADVRLRLSEDNRPLIALETEDSEGRKQVSWVPVVLSEKEMEAFFPAIEPAQESKGNILQEEIRTPEREESSSEEELVLIPLTVTEEEAKPEPKAPAVPVAEVSAAAGKRPEPGRAADGGREKPEKNNNKSENNRQPVRKESEETAVPAPPVRTETAAAGSGLSALLEALPSIVIEPEEEIGMAAAVGFHAAEEIFAPQPEEPAVPAAPAIVYDIPDAADDSPADDAARLTPAEDSEDYAAESADGETTHEVTEETSEETSGEISEEALEDTAENAPDEAVTEDTPHEEPDEEEQPAEEASGEDTSAEEQAEEAPQEDTEEASREDTAEEADEAPEPAENEAPADSASAEEADGEIHEEASEEENSEQPVTADDGSAEEAEQAADEPDETSAEEEQPAGEPSQRKKRRRPRPAAVQVPAEEEAAEEESEAGDRADDESAGESFGYTPADSAIAMSGEPEDMLFVRMQRPGAGMYRTTGTRLPRYINDDDFVERWLGDEEDEEDLATQKKRRRRRISAIVGAVGLLLALVGFVAIARWGVGLLGELTGSESQKEVYGEFISPVVMSEVPLFEAWDAIPQDKLLQSAVFSLLVDMDVTYERDDTGKFIIPSNDVVNAVKELYGARSDDPLEDEEINTRIRNALYGSADEDTTNEDAYYVDSEDSFHVADGLSGPSPQVIDISRRNETVTLTVEYLEDLEIGSGGILYSRQFVLTLTDGGYYVQAIREAEE